MPLLDKAVAQYINRYSSASSHFPIEPLLRLLVEKSIAPYDKVLVIPAFNENFDFIQHLINQPFNVRLLLILVINAPVAASLDSVKKNQDLVDWTRSQAQANWLLDKTNSALSIIHEHCDLLVVDGFSNQRLAFGVGEARKIGCDIALQLIAENWIFDSIIFTTDADVRLPNDYFDLVLKPTETSAVCNFKHVANEPWKIPIELYEIWLRHYVVQLKRCGSPYAFHTIGSLLAISAQYYANVRGFPLRNAGEDFYLLNKLAKLGAISYRKNVCVLLDARPSDRVPFGTGPAIRKIADLPSAEQDYLFYHPHIFTELKRWIDGIPQFFETDAVALPNAIHAILSELKVFEQIHVARKQFKTLIQFKQAVHTYFDGFKTLKTVHLLRDRYYPSINWQQLAEHYQVKAEIPADLLTHLESAD